MTFQPITWLDYISSYLKLLDTWLCEKSKYIFASGDDQYQKIIDVQYLSNIEHAWLNNNDDVCIINWQNSEIVRYLLRNRTITTFFDFFNNLLKK